LAPWPQIHWLAAFTPALARPVSRALQSPTAKLETTLATAPVIAVRRAQPDKVRGIDVDMIAYSRGIKGGRALRVLVLGADGFIGRATCAALLAAGHQPLRGVRRPDGKAPVDAGNVWVDYVDDCTPETWQPRLRDVDAVINTVGIFAERGAQTFERIHVTAPTALFQACRDAGVRRLVQVSALGADTDAATAFHRSKRRADEALHAILPNRGVVVRPSLVFGVHGASSRMLALLALLPATPLPDGGAACVQPIHVDDLAAVLTRLATRADMPSSTVDAVGPRALSLAAYLAALRSALAGGTLRVIALKTYRLRQLARWTNGRWLSDDALTMLARGNAADAGPVNRVLGRQLRDPVQFLDRDEADDLRRALAWQVAAPAMRWSVALVWLGSGITSLVGYPVAKSLAMLAAAGLHGGAAWTALFAGALLDIAVGIATLAWPRRALYLSQIAVIVGYTAIITFTLPGYWLHPFGPVLKNLPMLAVLVALYLSQRKGR
jgi:uncharacterized protein YbjT (DUF2867 family)